MPHFIKDGEGNGYSAGVTSNNRLKTNSVTINEGTQSNRLGDAYNINTGEITLSDATDTPVLYVKNNETKDLHITAIAVGLNTHTGGTATEMVRITVVRNPTTGTIITSTPTDVDIVSNRNYGSANTLSVDAYKGATGDTMTDGEDHIIFFQSDFGRLFAGIEEILPTGASIGIKIDAPASTTDFDVYAALVCHLEDV